jgi:radical SAM protein with 4Fe4S-binding SPASM domain
MMKREHGFMEIELFQRVLAELKPYLYNLNLYFQGEPMLHPAFFSFLHNSKDIHSTVSTNGHFLSQENAEKIVRSGLNKLIISLDGMDQASYSAYRIKGSLNSVMQGIINVTDAKNNFNSSIDIEMQILVNRLNEKEIPQIRLFAKSIRIPLRLKSMQIINKEEIEFWLPQDEKYRRYKIKDGVYVNKNTLPDRCARLWFNPVITWDGKVLPCCFDKDGEHVMGDLNQESFQDIWEGPKYRIFRQSVLSGRHMIGICRNCTSGLRGVRY